MISENTRNAHSLDDDLILTCIIIEVLLRHNNSVLSNQSIVDLEEITRGSFLFCLTNTTACCTTGDGGLGGWYFPNGGKVLNSGAGFSVERGTSFIALTYSGSASPPSGLYRCVVPDSNNQSVTLFAGIYGNNEGKIIIRVHLFKLVPFECRYSCDHCTN